MPAPFPSAVSLRARHRRSRRSLSFEPLESRLPLSATYDIDLVVDAASQGYSSIKPGASINDQGTIAYVATSENSSGELADNLYAFDPVENRINTLMNPVFMYPREGTLAAQNLVGEVQVNNQNQVLARRFMYAYVQVGFPFGTKTRAPLTYLETWDALADSPPGLPTQQIAMGDGGAGPAGPLLFFINPATGGQWPSAFRANSDFAGIYHYAAHNNHGQAAWGGLMSNANGGGNRLVSGLHSSGPQYLGVGTPGYVPHPRIADTGEILVYAGDSETLFRLPFSLTGGDHRTVASPADGFTDIGIRSDLSDDGNVVIFHATLSDDGANRINERQVQWTDSNGVPIDFVPITPGPGVFTAIETPHGWLYQRVAGIAGNGILDPGETFVDSNDNGILDGNEVDLGWIGGFDRDTRVSVSLSSDLPGATHLVFEALDQQGATAIVGGELFVVRDDTNQPVGHVDPIQTTPIVFSNTSLYVNDTGDLTIEDVQLGDPLNVNGQVLFWAKTSRGEVLLRANPARVPVMILPGIGGTFPTPEATEIWEVVRGLAPGLLEADPITKVYDKLVHSFIKAGYRLGKDLYVVPYDWRLNPGPTDDGVLDGFIDGITGTSISSPTGTGQFKYGVDYLGYWLKQASQDWEARFPGLELEQVDVLGHSTGGLVTRTYIQSAAYGSEYAPGKFLPTIRNFVMYDVPNYGAPKAWSFLQDDWFIDRDVTYPVAFRSMMNLAFQKVVRGGRIRGADYDITLADVVPGSASDRRAFQIEYLLWLADLGDQPAMAPEVRRRFVQKYVPTIRGLLATYSFLDRGAGPVDVNADPDFNNVLVLDLNSNSDPNYFASLVETTINIFGQGVSTTVGLTEQVGPSLSQGRQNFLLPFDHVLPRLPRSGQTWYSLQKSQMGDGTVPYASLATPYLSDSRVVNREFVTDALYQTYSLREASQVIPAPVDHVGIVGNPHVHQEILALLGVHVELEVLTDRPFESSLLDQAGYLYHLLNDPVDAYIVDAEGNRLGYSTHEGRLTEMPRSEYWGGDDGWGLVAADSPQSYELKVVGTGRPYYVLLTGEGNQAYSGIALAGTLPIGQTVQLQLPPLHDLDAGPQVFAEQASTMLNQPVTLPILANDPGVDLQLHSLAIIVEPQTGHVVLDPSTGRATYHPEPGFVGQDAFEYAVQDAQGEVLGQATVSIDVQLSQWRNPRNPFDVNADGLLAPLDALVLINTLNAHGSRPVPQLPNSTDVPPPFFDVDSNGAIEPVDVLRVINELARTNSAEGEAAWRESGVLLSELASAHWPFDEPAGRTSGIREETCASQPKRSGDQTETSRAIGFPADGLPRPAPAAPPKAISSQSIFRNSDSLLIWDGCFAEYEDLELDELSSA